MVDPELKQSKEWRQMMGFYRWLKPGLMAMRLPWIGPRFAEELDQAGKRCQLVHPSGAQDHPGGGSHLRWGSRSPCLMR